MELVSDTYVPDSLVSGLFARHYHTISPNKQQYSYLPARHCTAQKEKF